MKPRFLDPRSAPHIVTLVLLAGLSALSMNIFLPSLPGMARYFGVDYAVMQLSVSAYLAASAILQVAIGPISDRYGRRPVLLGTLAVFLFASVGAILAPTAGWFLFFRMAQASCATGIALSRAVIRDMVPADEAASMIGYVTMGMSIVPMIGPAIGGILDEAFGWQASFSALALMGLAVFLLCWRDLGETAHPSGRGFAAQVAEYPELLKSPRFWGYCLSASLASGAFFAYLGGAPFIGQEVLHLSPAVVGYYFSAPAIGYAIGNFFAGRYSARVGVDRMVILGTGVATAGLALGAAANLVVTPHPMTFFPFVGIMALGNGLSLPNANAGLLSVRPSLAGSASGLGGAMMIGGGAALAALAGAVLTVETGAFRLLMLMFISSLGSLAAILAVRRRARALGL